MASRRVAAHAYARVAELRRDLTLIDAIGIGFGAIVGAGIFVVTGVAAGSAGPAFLISLFIAAIAAAANALSSAQLGAEYPQAGGTYEYGHQLLHPWAGFAAGWMFVASKIAAAGTVALGLAGYVDALVPGVWSRVIAVGAIVAFTVLNYLGVKRSSRANLAIVTISVGALLLFVVVGAAAFRFENLRPFAPRAIVLTVSSVALLYMAVAVVAVGAIGADAMAATSAPLYVAALAFPTSWVATGVALGGVTAMLGVILSQLLGLSRMMFAMARRGEIPRSLEEIHPRYQVPGRAVLLVGTIAAVVAATGTLRMVASAATFTILVYYGITNLAALKLPRAAKIYSDAVPLVGLIGCTVLALSLTFSVVITGTAVLLVGFALRAVAMRSSGAGSS
jgi:APA family basic amino acid/polyamine antiporter